MQGWEKQLEGAGGDGHRDLGGFIFLVLLMCREVFAEEKKNSAVGMKVDLESKMRGQVVLEAQEVALGTMLLPNGITPAMEPTGKSCHCGIRIWGVSFTPLGCESSHGPIFEIFLLALELEVLFRAPGGSCSSRSGEFEEKLWWGMVAAGTQHSLLLTEPGTPPCRNELRVGWKGQLLLLVAARESLCPGLTFPGDGALPALICSLGLWVGRAVRFGVLRLEARPG